MKIMTLCVTVVSVLYVTTGVGLYFGNALYMLPSYDSSSYSYPTPDDSKLVHHFDVGIQIGLCFLCAMLLA